MYQLCYKWHITQVGALGGGAAACKVLARLIWTAPNSLFAPHCPRSSTLTQKLDVDWAISLWHFSSVPIRLRANNNAHSACPAVPHD